MIPGEHQSQDGLYDKEPLAYTYLEQQAKSDTWAKLFQNLFESHMVQWAVANRI